MNLWIPDIGDQLCLTESWEFPLFLERRNNKLVQRVDPTVHMTHGTVSESIGCQLPAGTVLQVDRVFIRQGQSRAYSSITFWIKLAPGDEEKQKSQRFKGARFWAKLMSVNEIVCDQLETKIK
jgi:hypothetical protein